MPVCATNNVAFGWDRTICWINSIRAVNRICLERLAELDSNKVLLWLGHAPEEVEGWSLGIYGKGGDGL